MAEYQQLDALLPPALIVAYHINVNQLIDFRQGFSKEWNSLWQDFYCDWRKLYFNGAIEPPTWIIGDEVISAGGKGIIFKSTLTGGDNLVLYNETLKESDSIKVYDPDQLLPKNQNSWS